MTTQLASLSTEDPAHRRARADEQPEGTQPKRSAWPAILALILGVVCLGIAVFTRVWVLTAIPIGLLFGFFLQKADLCGSSAFSEALMFKDWRKLGGIGVIIVASMVGFALLDMAGLIKL